MAWLSNNFIADFFRYIINFFYGLTGEYWIAIIILTVLIKLVMLPLDLKQRKSSMRMTKLQGKIADIKKRYANDQRKQNEKIQELYRKEGVSPMSGCLPMLLQMPIFFALLGAINLICNAQLAEMVQTVIANPGSEIKLDGWLWIHNILQPDSGLAKVLPDASQFVASMQRLPNLEIYEAAKAITETEYTAAVAPTLAQYQGYANGWFILPLLAGGSSYLQNVLMSKSGQMQQQQQGGMMMKFLFPVMSIWICTTASAIFSLYWLTSNVYAILQQMVIIKIYKSKINGDDGDNLRGGKPIDEADQNSLKEGNPT